MIDYVLVLYRRCYIVWRVNLLLVLLQSNGGIWHFSLCLSSEEFRSPSKFGESILFAWRRQKKKSERARERERER